MAGTVRSCYSHPAPIGHLQEEGGATAKLHTARCCMALRCTRPQQQRLRGSRPAAALPTSGTQDGQV